MAVTDLRDALDGVMVDCWHYIAPQQKAPPYIIWGETGISGAVDADDRTQTLLTTGELWYYTADEYDTTVHKIIDALESVGAAWRIDNIGRDNSLHLFVYGFSWSLPCGSSEIY